jgi:SAM-dependent methyltransferase
VTDRSQWDERHRESEFLGEHAALLEEVSPHLPRGRALDLACGLGANALYLASRGFRVDALDWSVEALKKLGSAAASRDLAVRPLACDVTRFPLPASRYDVVLSFRFLERSLWDAIVRALRPGGALVFETFTVRHLDDRPGFPRGYCLETNELVRAFSPRLDVAIYRELPSEATASLLAFRGGRRGA